MNWDYITGFFDADGSITACILHKGGNRIIQVSFHNNELDILNQIKDFIKRDIDVEGHISKKKTYSLKHNVPYDLTYRYLNGLKVANKMASIHPKKSHRIKIYNLIQENTKRNGKYTEAELLKRNNLVDEFFKYN